MFSSKKRFLYLANKGIFNKMDDEKYLSKLFYARMGKKLDLKNPKTFNEKLQWLKLYNRNPEYTVMVDKYHVKRYVAEKIGEEYVIPPLGVWKNFDDIDFSSLPDQFVLKCTHDSGGLVICDNKAKLDLESAKKNLEASLKRNYYYHGREWPYKDVEPQILAEQYLENDPTEGLHDYKIWCFNGVPTYVQYITGRRGTTTYEGFYTFDWTMQDFSYHNPLMKEPVEAPKKLGELFTLASKLAENIPFARVDFYVLPDDSLKFGEITFYPNCGTEKWHPQEMDLKLGEMIDLPNK